MTDPAAMIERLKRSYAGRASTAAGPMPRLSLDWRAYFREFCEAHGRFPLLWAGRLLFPDGWTYSATDHAGPEWPPPEDEKERRRLQRTYWKLRRSAVRRELGEARMVLEQLRELVETRDVMPRQRTVLWDEEQGRYVANVGPVDPEAAQERVTWLEEDLAICSLKIVDPAWEPADQS